MLKKAKNWIIGVLIAVVALLSIVFMGKKPQWINDQEKKIEDRENTIKKAEEAAGKTKYNYEEMGKKHDEEIEKIGNKPGKPDIDNPDDAAHYLDDVLSDGSR